jgi:hypothetical protein
MSLFGIYNELLIWVTGPDWTGESLGHWVKCRINECSRGGIVHFYWGDQKRFEAHNGAGSTDTVAGALGTSSNRIDFQLGIKNMGQIRGRGQKVPIKFSVDDKLDSGAAFTSYHSIIRNMIATCHAFGIPVKGNLAGAINGDDYFIIASKLLLSLHEFQSKQLELGFECSMNHSTCISDVTFCQNGFYSVGNTLIAGPLIGRTLSRAPYSASEHRMDALGIALGNRAICSHIPILWEYYERVAQLAPEGTVEKFNKYKLQNSGDAEADEATWAYVHKRYGLLPGDLEDFKGLLRRVKHLGSLAVWPHLERVAALDKDA